MRECKKCGKLSKIFSQGECLNCSKLRYIKNRKEKRKERHTFFNSRIGNSGVCVESGTVIKELKSSNVCHIFPKRIYKSIETNEDNIIILTAEMHSKLDMYLDNMDLGGLKENMPKSYQYILDKFAVLKDSIKETDKKLFNLIKDLTT